MIFLMAAMFFFFILSHFAFMTVRCYGYSYLEVHVRPRLVVGVVVFFILAAGLLAAIMSGPNLLASRISTRGTQPSVTSGNPIVLENTHLGTNAWKIPAGKESSTQIQAYASTTSVLPGQELTFYASTQQEGTVYSMDIYRLGWYGGFGGRLMTSVAYQTG